MLKIALKITCTAVLLSGVTSILAQVPRINPEAKQTTSDAQLAAMAALFEQRPDAQGLSQMTGLLNNLSRASDDNKAEAKKLVAEAAPYQKDGNTGEAKRRLSHAVSLLLDRPWTDQQEFGSSLVLRSDLAVADLNQVFLMQLSQSFPIRYAAGQSAGKNLKLRLSVTEAAPRVATDVVIPSGKALRELTTVDVPNRDLIDDPLRLAVDLKSVAPGAYLLIADLSDGDAVLARVAVPVYLAQNIGTRRVAIEQKLAKIKGHESTRATIRYPFALAEGLNARRVEITSFDFAGQITRAEQLTDALTYGKDLLVRAKGDAHRNYLLTEANEIIPYRQYVPKSWDGKKKLPMIVALHGGSLDENNMLDRGDGIMGKLAEQYGFIIASPLGYRVNGGYGGTNTSLLGQLSEKDVLNVMEIVAAEYNVDRSRIYMMGNSMGAGGTWMLASKYGEKFAGLAPCASSMNIKSLSFEKFKNMPVLACVGELDIDARKQTAKFGISQVKEISPHAEYLEVPGGTHGTGVQIAMPQIFEFFSKYTRHE